MSSSRTGSAAGLEAGFRLGAWRVDPKAGQLRRLWPRRQSHRVEPKAMQVLLALARHTGQFRSKEVLIAEVWDGRPVTDDCLTGAIHSLRNALNDNRQDPKFIETRTHVGYRLIRPVKALRSSQLKWLSATATAATAIVTISMLLFDQDSISGASDQQTIAVLPFLDFSHGESSGYLSNAMTDSLIRTLSQSSHLQVISRTSVLPYQDATRPRSTRRIAQLLGADLLVEGSVQTTSENVRISAQLINPDNGNTLWTQEYDRPLADLLNLQSEISNSIARRLGQLVNKPFNNDLSQTRELPREALNGFLLARYQFATATEENVKQALQAYQQLAKAEPGFAPFHLGVAQSILALFKRGAIPATALDRALDSARQAERLTGGNAEIHRCLGQLRLFRDWDFAAAERHYLQAIKHSPSDTVAHRRYAWLLVAQQDYQLAAEHIETIRLLDPLYYESPEMAALLLYSGQIAEAASELERLLEITEPSAPLLRLALQAYEASQQPEQAMAVLRRLAAMDATPSISYRPQLQNMNRTELLQLLLRQRDYRSPIVEAGYLSALGRNHAALASLETAVANHDPSALYLGAMPEFQALHELPRFKKLLSVIGITNGNYYTINSTPRNPQ